MFTMTTRLFLVSVGFAVSIASCAECETEWTLERTYDVSTDCGGPYDGRIAVRITRDGDTTTSDLQAEPPTLTGAASGGQCSDSSVEITISQRQGTSPALYSCQLPTDDESVECSPVFEGGEPCTARFTPVP